MDGKWGPQDHEKWQGVLQSGKWVSLLERGPAYPRITESDPVLHPVPKGLKAHVGVITEVLGHAHVLPPAILDLEQLQTEKWREKQVPQVSIFRKDLWSQLAKFVGKIWASTATEDVYRKGEQRCRVLGIKT